jgi:hypothetical protein
LTSHVEDGQHRAMMDRPIISQRHAIS